MKRCGLAAPIAARLLFQEIPNLLQEPQHPGIMSTKMLFFTAKATNCAPGILNDPLFG